MPLKTWNAGDVLPAADMNTYVRDGAATLLSICRKSGLQSVQPLTADPIAWDIEDLDTDGAHSTTSNNSRFTPTYSGYFVMQLMVQITATTAGTFRELRVVKNGSGSVFEGFTRIPPVPSNTYATIVTLTSMPFYLNGTGDYVDARFQHDCPIYVDIQAGGTTKCAFWRLRG